MDTRIVGQKTLLMRMEEICAVVNSGLFTWSTTKDLGTPCITERGLADRLYNPLKYNHRYQKGKLQ